MATFTYTHIRVAYIRVYTIPHAMAHK